jgi:hypothetical protein
MNEERINAALRDATDREAGVDYDDVTRVLEKEAVEKFVDSYRELVEEIEKQGRALAC